MNKSNIREYSRWCTVLSCLPPYFANCPNYRLHANHMNITDNEPTLLLSGATCSFTCSNRQLKKLESKHIYQILMQRPGPTGKENTSS